MIKAFLLFIFLLELSASKKRNKNKALVSNASMSTNDTDYEPEGLSLEERCGAFRDFHTAVGSRVYETGSFIKGFMMKYVYGNVYDSISKDELHSKYNNLLADLEIAGGDEGLEKFAQKTSKAFSECEFQINERVQFILNYVDNKLCSNTAVFVTNLLSAMSEWDKVELILTTLKKFMDCDATFLSRIISVHGKDPEKSIKDFSNFYKTAIEIKHLQDEKSKGLAYMQVLSDGLRSAGLYLAVYATYQARLYTICDQPIKELFLDNAGLLSLTNILDNFVNKWDKSKKLPTITLQSTNPDAFFIGKQLNDLKQVSADLKTTTQNYEKTGAARIVRITKKQANRKVKDQAKSKLILI